MSGHRSVGQDCSHLKAETGLEGLLERWLTPMAVDGGLRSLLALGRKP